MFKEADQTSKTKKKVEQAPKTPKKKKKKSVKFQIDAVENPETEKGTHRPPNSPTSAL